MQTASFRPSGTPSRIVVAAATALFSLGSFALVLAGFDKASPSRWLTPTPEVMEMVSLCDTAPDRGTREACMRQIVTALLERQHREVLLAKR